MAKKIRQAQREQERAQRARQRRFIYLGVGLVAAVIIIGAAVLVFSPKPVASGQVALGTCSPIETPPDGGRDHLQPGQTPSYTSNPPASGAHNPNPQPPGIYDSPIDPTMEVHSLEHGYVIIHYNGIPSDQLQQLKDLVSRDPRKMILSPYPSMPYKVTMIAWDHLQTCTGVSGQDISSFVAEFRDQGPESTPF